MTTDSAAAASPHPWLRLVLALVAAVDLIEAVPNVQYAFFDYHHQTAVLRFAQALTSIKLVLAPFVASAALVFAAVGRLRHAVLSLATLILLTWVLHDAWSIPLHGLEFSLTFGGVIVFANHVVFPAVAIAGALLAMKDQRLALAGFLVSVPTLIDWAGFVAFAVGIMLYGF